MPLISSVIVSVSLRLAGLAARVGLRSKWFLDAGMLFLVLRGSSDSGSDSTELTTIVSSTSELLLALSSDSGKLIY